MGTTIENIDNALMHGAEDVTMLTRLRLQCRSKPLPRGEMYLEH
jgi:hypothetical protein